MNAKLESFIKQKRAEHLISLDLIDENKCSIKREYLDCCEDGCGALFDEEKNQFYIEIEEYEPIDITDEEYEELLKYAPIEHEKYSVTIEHIYKTIWANRIKLIADVLIAINIIGGIITFFVLLDSWSTAHFAWIPIVTTLTYCIFWYPLIVGFSKIVAFAEKNINK